MLTLKETAGGLHVRTARKDNNQCSGNLTFSACFTDHTTVTIRAIILAQGSGEFRSFECEATLLLESVTTVKHVGQLDINVTGVYNIGYFFNQSFYPCIHLPVKPFIGVLIASCDTINT